MSSVFSSIGSSLGGAFKKSPLSFIGAGTSALSNFLGNRTRNKYLQDQINYQKYLRSLTSDPAKMSAYVSGFEKPLDQGLVSSVNNQVQAFGAERGLSTSPQIMAEIEAQALGPLKQNQQQMAISEAMSALGLPAGTPNLGGQQPFDISAIIKNLLGGPAPTLPARTQVPVETEPQGQIPPVDVPSIPEGFDFNSLLGALG